jgi:hypothetical protein
MTGGYLAPAGRVPEDRPAPRTDEEELVKRFIINNSSDPKRVQFVRWGPHMSREEFVELAKEAGLDELIPSRDKEAVKERLAAFHGFIRVRFRGPESLRIGAGFAVFGGSGAGPESDKPPRKIVDHDYLFAVYAKFVIPVESFDKVEEGDNWKKTARKNFSKILPGIDPEK